MPASEIQSCQLYNSACAQSVGVLILRVSPCKLQKVQNLKVMVNLLGELAQEKSRPPITTVHDENGIDKD